MRPLNAMSEDELVDELMRRANDPAGSRSVIILCKSRISRHYVVDAADEELLETVLELAKFIDREDMDNRHQSERVSNASREIAGPVLELIGRMTGQHTRPCSEAI